MSVPVKDRYRDKGREENKNSRRSEGRKKAASAGALRRVEKEIRDSLQTADDQNFGDSLGGV